MLLRKKFAALHKNRLTFMKCVPIIQFMLQCNM